MSACSSPAQRHAGARGELPPEFVAYVPQLTSRLGSDEACDEFAAALHRLLEGAAASAGGAQAVGFELCALRRDETEPLRAAAAEKLFTRLRSRAPQFFDALANISNCNLTGRSLGACNGSTGGGYDDDLSYLAPIALWITVLTCPSQTLTASRP